MHYVQYHHFKIDTFFYLIKFELKNSKMRNIILHISYWKFLNFVLKKIYLKIL